MNDHRHLGITGWTLWLASTAMAYLEAHWAMVFSLIFGAIGAACHIVQTRVRIREYEDAKRARESAPPAVPSITPGVERLN